MGKIFKKIKRTVKKVTRPLGRIFKKVGGGIAKAGKYLYEGVKKVGGKIMSGYAKLSDKLGPIGMIGLSMAMPYLLGGFSGAGGGLWTNFGTKMGGVVGKGGTVLQKGLMHSENPFLKVIGHAGKSIYNASNFVGGTTRGITQTITKTFGEFANGNVSQGFANLYKGTSEVLSGKAGMGTMNYIDAAKVANGLSSSVAETGVKLTTQNLGTLVQTGGVSLGNVNIANKFAYDSISNAMAGTLKTLSPESLKYHRTLVKNVGLDDQSAYQYIINNGVDNVTGNLDKALSKDFVWGGHPVSGGYEWSGANLNETNKAFKLQAGGGYKYKPKVEGDIYESQASLMSKKSSYGSAVLDAMHKTLMTDNQEIGAYNTADGYNTANNNSKWLASNMSYAGGEYFLTDEQKKYFSLLKSNKMMDIG